MNRFLTHTGRQPIWLDDLDFIQESFADEIKKLVQGLVGMTNDAVILTGCNVTQNEDGTYTVSEGVIYLKGEILRLSEGVYAQIGPLRIREDVSYDSNGDRILQDSGDEVSCYRCNKAMLSMPKMLNGKPDTSPSFSSCIRLDDIISSKVKTVVLHENTIDVADGDAGKVISTKFHVKIYRKNESYYCDISFDSIGFRQWRLTETLDNVSVLSPEWDALAASEDGNINVPLWERCFTFASLNAICGISSDTVLPCSIILRTYNSSNKIVWEFNIIPTEEVSNAKPVYGSAHIKLNTL
jgi:hypothetical protein